MDKCRDSAELIMHYAKSINIKNLIIQEEGGWHTYEKSGKKLGFNIIKVPMNKGLIIEKKFPYIKNSLFIVNTNPGYAYDEPLNFFEKIKNNNIIIVNDVSGSINQNMKGDFIIGSFGEHKPVSISSGGGFLAFNNEFDNVILEKFKNIYFNESGKKINFQELENALQTFQTKKTNWIKFSNKIKQQLKNYNILNPEESINIFIKTSNLEMENLIKFCDEHNLEYVKCPLYIRTNEKAISIEIKKLKLEE